MIDALPELLKLGIVGLIAGFFSSIRAAYDYRQKTWWELRVTAYQNAIEALSDLCYYYDKQYEIEATFRELPEVEIVKLNTFWDGAFPKVRKCADTGAFLFSDQANIALQEFLEGSGNHQHYIEELCINHEKARKCLTRLVDLSKIDLRLENQWGFVFFRR